MTRYVQPAAMVAHLWANRSQDSARTPSNNFYFNGSTLFSYGSHYVVGYHLPNNGPTLLNSTPSTNTTNGHRSDARNAVSGNYLYAPELTSLVHRLPYIASAAKVKPVIRDYCKAALESYAGLSDETLRGLLAYAGLSTSFDKMKRDAAQVIARHKAEQVKKDKAAALETLKKWAAAEPVLFKTMQADLLSHGVYVTASHVVDQSAKQIRSAQRQLGKAKTPKRLWESSQRIVKALPDMVSELEAKRGNAARRMRVRQLVGNYRRYLENLASLWVHATESPSRETLRRVEFVLHNLHQVLESIAKHESGGLPEPMRDKATRSLESLEVVQESVVQEENRLGRIENAERERLRAQNEQQSRAAFFAGEPSQWRGSTESGSCYLSAVDVKRDDSGAITGGELRTSHGARVPLIHAIRAFRFVKLIRAQSENETTKDRDSDNLFNGPIAWQRNGDRVRVGSFELDSVYATGSFVAGCHKIAWPEIAALAVALGVFDLSASRDAVTHA